MAAESKPRLTPTFTRDEEARKSFVSNLRAHVLGHQARVMRERYDRDVEPAIRKHKGAVPASGNDVRMAMRNTRDFRFFSTVRTNAQEMVFASVIPAAEREMDTLATRAAQTASNAATKGSLSLNNSMDVPDNVTAIDVHLSPGSYHAEYREDDVVSGAIYESATRVFAFRQFGDDLDDIGMTMANFIRLRYPEIDPQKILDCGCTTGHNTVPWATTFPNAEVHAVDVAPGILRYAHARAQSLEIPVHFKQMDATRLDYPDASFDVVFSSMFLHELPVPDIKAYLREAHRVLKPGGVLINMELPPNSHMGAYESFYLDWDSYYNNEPFYKPFRDQNYKQLIEAGGFASDDFIEVTLPRYTFVGEDEFKAALDKPTKFDSQTGRMDPKGTRWYGFGAIKR